jgi:PAS domain S-box-containing protein
MENKKVLKILFVEDLVSDFEIAQRELQKSGLEFISERVETKDAFLKALTEFKPDIIISDYSMPTFDGMLALKLSLEFDTLLPFIILTGSVNEKTAVECMKSGATDYVIKGHTSRLPFAVNEAIEKSIINKEKEKAIEELRESEANYRTLADSGMALIWTSGTDKLCNYFNKIWLDFTGRTIDQELGNGWTEGVHPDDLDHCINIYTKSFVLREPFTLEYRLCRHDGEYRWLLDKGMPRHSSTGEFIGYIGHCLDITDRKKDEELLIQTINEKEILIRELYHRTKNSLQVIASLLELQAGRLNDKKLDEVMKNIIDKILVMALVHQKLFKTLNLSIINVPELINDISNLLIGRHDINPERINIKVFCRRMQYPY